MQMAKALHCLESFAHGSGKGTNFHLFVSCNCGILTPCRHRMRDQQGWFTRAGAHSSAEIRAANASDALVDASDCFLVPQSPQHAADSFGAGAAASLEHTAASHTHTATAASHTHTATAASHTHTATAASHTHTASDTQNGFDQFHHACIVSAASELRSAGGDISESHPDVDATSSGNVANDVCGVSRPHDQQQQQESSSTPGSSASSASQSQATALLQSGLLAAMDGLGYDLIASNQSCSSSPPPPSSSSSSSSAAASSSSSTSVAATTSGAISKPPLSLRERMSL
jgi:hypothetical protein